MTTTPGVIHAVNALSDGFGARDVDRCLACYVPDDDISYVGSEHGETAHGRQAVYRLLTKLFLRPEAYSWDLTSAVVHPAGNLIHLTAEASGHVTTDGGSREDFPYRISGLLQPTSNGWQWRICVGAEPAVPQPMHWSCSGGLRIRPAPHECPAP